MTSQGKSNSRNKSNDTKKSIGATVKVADGGKNPVEAEVLTESSNKAALSSDKSTEQPKPEKRLHHTDTHGFRKDVKQRMVDHSPTAIIMTTGNLELTEETLVKPDGRTSAVKTFKVKATPEDDRRPIDRALSQRLFYDLSHINVIVTNACNLSCDYCYEQHKKDYGRWTVEKLKKIYDFLHENSESPERLFQFFGGEPLIQKKLILKFLEKYEDELRANGENMRIGMVTNGLLLDKEFMDRWFSFPNTTMTLSLDTVDVDKDHRQLTQKQMDHILSMTRLVPETHKANNQTVIRATISRETAPDLKNFVKTLYDNGVVNIIIHPLTMSNYKGFIQWSKEEWSQLLADIDYVLKHYDDLRITFSEGVGTRGGANCLVGSGMIAVDATGDYSGCYFFTNAKEAASKFTLGNLFDQIAYMKRYRDFDQQYHDMFKSDECKSCDLKGFCYQCPAGNLDTSGKLFTPDGMCKNIVQMFLNVNDMYAEKRIIKKYKDIAGAIAEIGEGGHEKILGRMFAFLTVRQLTGYNPIDEDVDDCMNANQIPHYKKLLAAFEGLSDVYKFKGREGAINSRCDLLEFFSHVEELEPIEMLDGFKAVLRVQNVSPVVAEGVEVQNQDQEHYIAAFINALILRAAVTDFEDPKNKEGRYREA